jgi:hypothetical protein
VGLGDVRSTYKVLFRNIKGRPGRPKHRWRIMFNRILKSLAQDMALVRTVISLRVL